MRLHNQRPSSSATTTQTFPPPMLTLSILKPSIGFKTVFQLHSACISSPVHNTGAQIPVTPQHKCIAQLFIGFSNRFECSVLPNIFDSALTLILCLRKIFRISSIALRTHRSVGRGDIESTHNTSERACSIHFVLVRAESKSSIY